MFGRRALTGRYRFDDFHAITAGNFIGGRRTALAGWQSFRTQDAEYLWRENGLEHGDAGRFAGGMNSCGAMSMLTITKMTMKRAVEIMTSSGFTHADLSWNANLGNGLAAWLGGKGR